jgi:hypothetical protein
MEIVAGMVRAGAAQIVMGNHEFNALCFHTPDGNGEYLRHHTKQNCAQHAATLAYFEKNPGAKQRALTSFYSFPLWLDLGFARVVHAAWSPAAIRSMKTPYLTPEGLVRASTKGTPEYQAIETLLKGVEATLPDKIPYFEKDGHERTEIRVRWWMIRCLSRAHGRELMVGWRFRRGIVTVSRHAVCAKSKVYGILRRVREGGPVFSKTARSL